MAEPSGEPPLDDDAVAATAGGPSRGVIGTWPGKGVGPCGSTPGAVPSVPDVSPCGSTPGAVPPVLVPLVPLSAVPQAPIAAALAASGV